MYTIQSHSKVVMCYLYFIYSGRDPMVFKFEEVFDQYMGDRDDEEDLDTDTQ